MLTEKTNSGSIPGVKTAAERRQERTMKEEILHPSQEEEPQSFKKIDLILLHRGLCDKARFIMEAKNSDYTGGAATPDPFANFRNYERLNVCSAKVGILSRMVDKISRISTFVGQKKLQVSDETVVDTIVDLINYSILLAGVLQEDKENGRDKDTNTGATAYRAARSLADVQADERYSSKAGLDLTSARDRADS
jgi:hypothetical protein